MNPEAAKQAKPIPCKRRKAHCKRKHGKGDRHADRANARASICTKGAFYGQPERQRQQSHPESRRNYGYNARGNERSDDPHSPASLRDPKLGDSAPAGVEVQLLIDREVQIEDLVPVRKQHHDQQGDERRSGLGQQVPDSRVHPLQ